jgi:GNAT superfamily N-acetyltransferase
MQWQRNEFTLSDDTHRLDISEVCRLLRRTYWAENRPNEAIRRSVLNSLSFGLYEQAKLIGFARVVTDRATVGYLCDVVIAEAYQRRGLGQWMIACILGHPDLVDCRIDLFTRDGHAFYQRFGFGPHRFTSMVRYPDTEEQERNQPQ